MTTVILLSAILISIIILIVCVIRLGKSLRLALKLNSDHARKHSIIAALISYLVEYDESHGFTLNGMYDPKALESLSKSMNRFANKLIKNGNS